MKLFNGPSLSDLNATLKSAAVQNHRAAAQVQAAQLQATRAQATRSQISHPAPQSREASLPSAPECLRIIPIPRLLASNRWQFEGMRAQAEAVLLWITRGQGRVTMAGLTRGYGAHNALFIPAGVMHSLDIGAQTQGIAIFFGQNSDVTLPQSVQHLRIREATPQSEVLGIIEQIQREMTSDKIGADRAARHHIGLLGVWLERQVEAARADAPKPSAAKRLVARFSALLERDFRTGHGIADYAQALNVTPTHLTRACRECCGRSASDVLQDRRHFEACRLLTETQAPMKDIATSLGFSTAAYFTRTFQQRSGKTPSAFRKGM
ncbi:helix-turn-helix domain-containing protein [Albirhodobacter sp. R86504]|uniref:helix-turn-helix domain-containing protein n=1 Tax=Albirhodobacter sp. R86504 TaxID=3093848 RepID=UPI00366BBC2D